LRILCPISSKGVKLEAEEVDHSIEHHQQQGHTSHTNPMPMHSHAGGGGGPARKMPRLLDPHGRVYVPPPIKTDPAQ
jgi:hypothetical protein